MVARAAFRSRGHSSLRALFVLSRNITNESLAPTHGHRNLPGGHLRLLQALRNWGRRDAASMHHLLRSHWLSLECHVLRDPSTLTLIEPWALPLRRMPKVSRRANNRKIHVRRAAAWRDARPAKSSARAARSSSHAASASFSTRLASFCKAR